MKKLLTLTPILGVLAALVAVGIMHTSPVQAHDPGCEWAEANGHDVPACHDPMPATEPEMSNPAPAAEMPASNRVVLMVEEELPTTCAVLDWRAMLSLFGTGEMSINDQSDSVQDGVMFPSQMEMLACVTARLVGTGEMFITTNIFQPE